MATAVETTTVRSAAMEERPMVVHTIVLAFAADPVVRWCWPEAHQYLESMAAFTVAFAGGGFRDGSAYTTTGTGAPRSGCRPMCIQMMTRWATSWIRRSRGHSRETSRR